MAVAGIDLRPLWQKLIVRLLDGTIEPGEGLDLSLIAQLLGDKKAGLAIQDQILCVASAVPFAVRGGETAAARSGAGGCDRHRQQHADRVSAGAVCHRADDAVRRCRRRIAGAAARS